MVSPASKRESACWLKKEFSVSERRACRVLSLSLATYRYQPKRRDGCLVRQRLVSLAAQRPRFGYRRLHVMLIREGFKVNHKRIYRLYQLEGLKIRRKRRKRVAYQCRKPMVVPTGCNERWSMDFVSDQLSDGRRFRTLNIIDDFSRECLDIRVGASLPGSAVVEALELIASRRGYPKRIVNDNGPEFTSRALDSWASSHGVTLDFIEPGKPTQNAFAESFNGKFRDECLNQHWFVNLQQARRDIENWRNDYNHVRPHSSLGNKAPVEFARLAA